MDNELLLDKVSTTTSLFKAVLSNSQGLVSELLGSLNDTEINELDGIGYSPCHYAVKLGHWSIFIELLKAGADPNQSSREENYTVLHFLSCHTPVKSSAVPSSCSATQHSIHSLFEALINAGANVRATDKEGSSPLHLACRYSNTDMVALLLQQDTNLIMAKNNNGDTPIHESFQNNNVELINVLVKNISQEKLFEALKATNTGGITAFHVASFEGHANILQEILDSLKGGNIIELVNVRDGKQKTPLHYACEKGSLQSVEQLIKHAAEVTPEDAFGVTPLHLASCYGHEDIVRKLSECMQHVDVVDKAMQTSVHYAAKFNHANIISHLFQCHADISARDKSFSTPLHLAAMEGHMEACNALIDCGVSPRDTDGMGRNIVHIMALRNHSNLLKEILSVDGLSKDVCEELINSTDMNSDTPLHLAAENGNSESVQVLLCCPRISVGYKNMKKRTPIHSAAANGHAHVIKILLNYKCNYLLDDKEGNTALHLACKNGSIKATKLLLKQQVGLNSRNILLQTPLHVSCLYGNHKIVQILIDAGCEVNPIGMNYEAAMPLHLAVQHGHLEVVEVLLNNKTRVDVKDPTMKMTPMEMAIKFGHQSIAMAIIESDQWEDALKQVLPDGSTPFRELIKMMPVVAKRVLNRCVLLEESGKVKYNFDYVEDYHLHNMWKSSTSACNEIEDGVNTADSGLSSWGFSFNNRIEHPLLLMTQHKCKDLLDHSLSISLINFKWKKYGLAGYKCGLILYTIMLLFITLLALLSPNPQDATCIAISEGHFGQTGNETEMFVINGSTCVPFSSVNNSVLKNITAISMSMKHVCSVSVLSNSCGLSEVDCGLCPQGSLRVFFLRLFAALVFITSLLHLLFEAFRLTVMRRKYISGFKDVFLRVEIVVYVISILLSSAAVNECVCASSWQWQTGVIAILLVWIGFLVYIRMFPNGIYIIMFYKIVRTFIKMLVFMSFLVVAFSLSFYMAFQVPSSAFFRSSFANPTRSLVKVMTMTTGEFDFDSIFRQFPGGATDEDIVDEIPFLPVSFLLWILFLIIMPLLLINLLTALALDDVKQIQQDSELQSLSWKIEYSLNMERILPKKLRYYFLKQLVDVELEQNPSLSQEINYRMFGLSKNHCSDLNSFIKDVQKKNDIDNRDSQIKEIKENVEGIMEKLSQLESYLNNVKAD